MGSTKPQFRFWKEGKSVKTPIHHLPFLAGETWEDNEFCLALFLCPALTHLEVSHVVIGNGNTFTGKWILGQAIPWPHSTTSSTNYYRWLVLSRAARHHHLDTTDWHHQRRVLRMKILAISTLSYKHHKRLPVSAFLGRKKQNHDQLQRHPPPDLRIFRRV